MSSEDETSNSQLPIKFKRRRLQGACDICRQKKIRCDSAKMPGNKCSNCIAFNSECTHIHINRKAAYRLRQPSETPFTPSEACSLSQLRDSMAPLLRNILSSTYQSPSNPALVRETLVRLAHYIKALEDAISETTTASDCTSKTWLNNDAVSKSSSSIPTSIDFTAKCYSKATVEDDDDLEQLSEILKQSLMLSASQKRFFGPSSSVMLVKTALECSKGYGTAEKILLGVSDQKRPEYWTVRPWEIAPPYRPQTLIFPEPDLLDQLVNLYFVHINIHTPLLHWPTFEKCVKSGLHLREMDFGGLLLCVCALGSRYSKDHRVLLEGANSDHSSGWKYFNQLQFFRESFLQAPSLYELQTYSLAVLYLQGTSGSEKCWYLIGLGIRAAQDVGINRRNNFKDSVPTIESELSKRAFWIMVLMDIIVSSALGRPRAVHSSDYDIDLPIECDDEYWENSDPSLAFKQPPGKPSTVTAFNKIIALFDILGSAQQAFYSVRNPKEPKNISRDGWNQARLADFDASLNTWINNLPEHLHWDPYRTDQIFFDQAAMLLVTFYYVQIMVHRPFISYRNEGSGTVSAPSLAICTNAARACSRIMDSQSRRGFIPLPLVQNGLFMSALIILLSIWGGRQAGLTIHQVKEIEYVYKCVKVLRTFENRWHTAGRFCDVLIALFSVSGLPLPPTVIAKRSRDEFDDPFSNNKDLGNFNTVPWLSNAQRKNLATRVHFGENSTNGTEDKFTLSLYTEELRRPLFGSLHDECGDQSLDPVETFPFLFSGYQGVNGDMSTSLASNESFTSSVATNLSSVTASNSGNGQGDTYAAAMDIWTSVPSGHSWADWEAYITNVEGLMQGQQSLELLPEPISSYLPAAAQGLTRML